MTTYFVQLVCGAGGRVRAIAEHCCLLSCACRSHRGDESLSLSKSFCATAPSLQHFATGVSGIPYPPTVLECFRRAGSEFLECCPKADHVWLHAQTIRAGSRVGARSERVHITSGPYSGPKRPLCGGPTAERMNNYR